MSLLEEQQSHTLGCAEPGLAVDVDAPVTCLATNFKSGKMDYATAQQLMSTYARMGKIINEADSLIRTLPDAERSEHLRALAGLINHLWFTLQHPIVRQYRDLDPDGDYFRDQASKRGMGE
ncbi:hypothetical protein ACQ4WQ_10245 [Janthinobacterium sp. GB1R12]|uniref:hypothetical protein n=1 Tax=Janthinobacterium sp. GB1R12 TaxID=3424190 RepID=UPI003F1FA3E1